MRLSPDDSPQPRKAGLLTKLTADGGRTRRHVVTIGIASLSVGFLSACGTTATSTGSSSSSGSSSAGASASLSSADVSALVTAAHEGTGTTPAICHGKKYRIGIDIYPTTITFGADVVKGAKDIGISTGCVTPIILEDNLNAETVIANVKSFIQQKVDGIALLNAVEAPENEAIALAKAAHIPIVTASLGRPGTPFVDVNDGDAGLAEGAAVATEFKNMIGSQQPWIIIASFPLQPPASDRQTGWLAAVAKVFPNIPPSHILQFNGQLNPAVTTQLAQPLLAKIPQGAPILTLGINDDSSYALAKLVHDSGHPMLGSGFGGDHGGQKKVCSGFYNTSGWFPEKTMAYQYPALIAMMNGATLPDHVYQRTAVLTKATVNTYYPGTC
jgi:ABC-type sugar transport system substrate-binding protein